MTGRSERGGRALAADRSPDAAKWHRLYGTQRWKRRRLAQLTEEPFCAMCLDDGVHVVATVADHVEPHKGDEHLFWHGALQSLCERCHNSDKRLIELGSTKRGVDADGWPLWRGDEP